MTEDVHGHCGRSTNAHIGCTEYQTFPLGPEFGPHRWVPVPAETVRLSVIPELPAGPSPDRTLTRFRLREEKMVLDPQEIHRAVSATPHELPLAIDAHACHAHGLPLVPPSPVRPRQHHLTCSEWISSPLTRPPARGCRGPPLGKLRMRQFDPLPTLRIGPGTEGMRPNAGVCSRCGDRGSDAGWRSYIAPAPIELAAQRLAPALNARRRLPRASWRTPDRQ
jgi:hypothetical protein